MNAGDTTNDALAKGEAYDRFVGRWSRAVAREFLGWIEAPEGARWLDVGCGTGALAERVLERCAPAAVLGVDPGEAYLAAARERLGSRAQFRVGSTASLPVDDDAFDVAVSGLVLNLVPDPAAGLAEMRRACVPGGVVAAYVWDYAEGMQPIRAFWDAAVETDPQAHALDEAMRYPLCRDDALADRFREAGLDAVEVRAIEVDTVFRDFDEYWAPFLDGEGPAPTYATSLEPEQRDRLRERLRARLPARGDGAIALVARAWAARARVPG